jgi:hypothetical protein
MLEALCERLVKKHDLYQAETVVFLGEEFRVPANSLILADSPHH